MFGPSYKKIYTTYKSLKTQGVLFSFPFTIGSTNVDRALDDLYASINVNSSTICERPKRILINLVDKSVK